MKTPMLACSVSPKDFDPNKRYIVQLKLDGIRCTRTDQGIRTRTGKRLPNRHLEDVLQTQMPNNMDFELLITEKGEGQNRFEETQSVVMSKSHPDTMDIRAHVFDYIPEEGGRDSGMTAYQRQVVLDKSWGLSIGQFIVRRLPWEDMQGILITDRLVEDAVAMGYEGIMVRDSDSLYKFGRSTKKDLCLGKMKLRDDAEAVVTGIEQMVTKEGRTLCAAGALNCKMGEVTFKVGTGMDLETRNLFFRRPEEIVGKTISFYYQGFGSNGRPRFPAFKCIREEE